MRLDESLAAATVYAQPTGFENFRGHIDTAWIEECLCATGFASLRRRRLPAELVIWLVLAMALFRDRSIDYLVANLDIVLPSGRRPPARSSVADARQRLGDEPLKYLFNTSATEWATRSADAHRWHGLALYGVDGTTLRVPDTTENRATFGSASGARGDGGYPLVRLVVLMALRSHVLRAARFGPYRTSELELARQLWSAVPDDALTIVDRGFLSAADLIALERTGKNRHWLTRAKKDTHYRVVENLAPGDDIVEIEVNRAARIKNPDLPLVWRLRAIGYHHQGSPPSVLLTSLTDAARFPAKELIALYHERWELELGYDEIKTHLLAREESIRSKTPTGVRQEIWGQLLAYNLVRLEIERVAAVIRIEPTRLSFVNALRLIRAEWEWTNLAAPGAIPKHLRDLDYQLALLVLPPRRADRLFPRAVKIKMSNYPRKRSPGSKA